MQPTKEKKQDVLEKRKWALWNGVRFARVLPLGCLRLDFRRGQPPPNPSTPPTMFSFSLSPWFFFRKFKLS